MESLIITQEWWHQTFDCGRVFGFPAGKILNIIKKDTNMTLVQEPISGMMFFIRNYEYDDSESTVKYFKKI